MLNIVLYMYISGWERQRERIEPLTVCALTMQSLMLLFGLEVVLCGRLLWYWSQAKWNSWNIMIIPPPPPPVIMVATPLFICKWFQAYTCIISSIKETDAEHMSSYFSSILPNIVRSPKLCLHHDSLWLPYYMFLYLHPFPSFTLKACPLPVLLHLCCCPVQVRLQTHRGC